MKRKTLAAALFAITVIPPAYSVDWNAVQQNVASAPTTSNVEADKTAAEQRASTYDTTTYTTDTQVAANTNSSDALSEQVTSSDWLKNLHDSISNLDGRVVALDGRVINLETWTGAGGFTSALDLHNSLQGQINVVDNDLQGYKVSTNNTLSQHDTALKAISSYNGSAASAASAKVDNIASGAVGNTQIATNAVTSSKIMDGQVGRLDLAANSVDSSKIMDGQVGRADLAANSVDSSKVINNSLTGADITGLTGADINDGSITGTDIANGSITGTDIANGTITSNDLSSGATGGGSSSVSFVSYKKVTTSKGYCTFSYNSSTKQATIYTQNSTPYLAQATKTFTMPSDGGINVTAQDTRTSRMGDTTATVTYSTGKITCNSSATATVTN